MANQVLETIVAQYKIDVDGAIKEFDRYENAVLKGEKQIEQSSKRTTDSIVRNEQDAARKREKLYKEEQQDLKELEKRRKSAYSPEEIAAYNKRISETQNRMKLLRGEQDKANKSSSILKRTFAAIGTTIAAAFTVDRIISFTRQSVNLAKEARGVKRAFDNLDDPTLLSNLRTSVRGTVSDLELMKAAVRAKEFGIGTGSLPKFFEFAKIQSDKLGQSTEFLVNSIVDGIGRKSTLVLDNLGISAQEIQDEFKKTGDFAEAAAIVIERKMKDAADSTDFAKDATDRYAASIENLSVKLGEALLPALGAAAEETTGFFNVLQSNLSLFEKLGVIATGLTPQFTGLFSSLAQSDLSSTALERLIRDLQNLTQTELIALIGQLSELQQQIPENSTQFNALANAIEFVQKQLVKLNSTVAGPESTVETIATLEAKIKDLQTEQKNLDVNVDSNKQRFADLNEEIASIQARIERFKSGPFDGELLPTLEKEDIDNIESATEAVNDLGEAFTALRIPEEEISKGIEKLKEKDLAELEEIVKQTGEAIQDTIGSLVDSFFTLTDAFQQQAQDATLNRLDQLRDETERRNEIQEALLQQQLENGDITNEQFVQQRQALNQELTKIDNERRQKEREFARKQAIADKAAALFDIGINTQIAISKVLAQGGITAPAIIPLIVSQAAIAAATVAATPIPEFAKGVIDLQGPGTETSDSITARLSKGESVMTAKETREYRPIFEAIRRDEFDTYAAKELIAPVLKRQREAFNTQIMEMFKLNQATYDDTMLLYETRKNRSVNIRNSNDIGRSMAKELTRKNYLSHGRV